MQERPVSPELFSSPDSSQQSPQDTEELTDMFGEPTDSEEYCGSSLTDMYRNNNPWHYHTPQLNPSRHHTVLFEMPATLNQPPKPHYSSNATHWDADHVRMPFSRNNIFPVKENKQTVLKPRWEIIQLALLQPIGSSAQLEEAIFSYNLRHRKFMALHHFVDEVLVEEESKHFFTTLLPKIVQLALQLPELIQTAVPLLKQGRAHTVSLSQLQIASLLANAFLCTFPWKKDCVTYPGVNFNRLFECMPSQAPHVAEKLKCLLHYFRCVCTKMPSGVVTFERKHLSRGQLPRWDKNENSIGDIKLHITHKGTIEDDGRGCLQVDFANCMVGGGVLGYGCVQEEIRFAICPELLVSRLFTEQLLPNEALLIVGPQCFSTYTGYADSFEWAGNCNDETPHDEYGRRRTTIVAIDALLYFNTAVQFRPSKMIRELNKAYIGFCEVPSVSSSALSPVATGNWGCGAFRGNLHLKALIQIMACTAARRNIVYYTFGDNKLKRDVFHLFQFLASNRVTVAQLWKYLGQFVEAGVPSKQLLAFIKQSHLDTVNSTTVGNIQKITNFFTKRQSKPNCLKTSDNDDNKQLLTTNNTEAHTVLPSNQSNSNQTKPTRPGTSRWLPSRNVSQETSAARDIIIESSQEAVPAVLTRRVNNRNETSNKMKKMAHSRPLSVLISSDEDSEADTHYDGFLSCLDKLEDSNRAENPGAMDVEVSSDESLMEVCVTNGEDRAVTGPVQSNRQEGSTPKYSALSVAKKPAPMKISDYFAILK